MTHPRLPCSWLILGTLILTLANQAGAESPLYISASATEELLAHEGKKVIVYGQAEGSKQAILSTNYVRFKDAIFYLVTFKSDLQHFPDGEPTTIYEGKRLAVEGTLVTSRGKPNIKLTSPSQVTLLEEGTVFPPPISTSPATSATKETSAPSKASPTEAAPAPEAVRKPPVDPSEYFKK